MFAYKLDGTPREVRERRQRMIHMDNKFRPAGSSSVQKITVDFSADTRDNLSKFK